MTKTCNICRRERPIGEFETSKGSRDGRGYRCRACNRARARRQRTERAARLRWDGRDAHAEHPTGTKRCERCGKKKLVALFARDRCGLDGLQRWCKRCQIQQWQQRTYGRLIGPDEVCAICGGDKRLGLDHDHQTTRTRGVLCRTCNIALGYFNDDPARLRAAADYIERSAS